MRSGGYSRMPRAMRALDLDVIGLEALVDCLHGVVHRDLHQCRVNSPDRARTPGDDRLLCNLVPVDYRVARGWPRGDEAAEAQCGHE